MKRTYDSPQAMPTGVEFERALLVTTTRLVEYVDETENVNADIENDQAPGSEMYFEF